jgi:hypothetical protein
MATMFSITKIKDAMKENKGINPVYILLILLSITFIFQKLVAEIGIALVFFIIGIIGNIYNYKQKDKYYKSGMIIYTLILIYGISLLLYII